MPTNLKPLPEYYSFVFGSFYTLEYFVNHKASATLSDFIYIHLN